LTNGRLKRLSGIGKRRIWYNWSKRRKMLSTRMESIVHRLDWKRRIVNIV